jgi:hypothetical protein
MLLQQTPRDLQQVSAGQHTIHQQSLSAAGIATTTLLDQYLA